MKSQYLRIAINLTKDELYFYEAYSELKGVSCDNVVLNSFVEKTVYILRDAVYVLKTIEMQL